MQKIKEFLNRLREKTNKIIGMKYFLEIYCGIIAALAMISWLIGNTYGMILVILSGIIALILTDCFNYVVPQVLYVAYTVSTSYYSFYEDKVSFIVLAVVAIIFVVILAVSVFKRGVQIHKFKSIIPMIGLAICNLLPIFWCKTIGSNPDYQIFYINYVGDLCYLGFYFLVCTGIKGNILKLFSTAASFLGILLSLECLVMVIKFRDAADNILNLWYSVGWGLCNEAAIIICFSLPFVFYLAAKATTYKGIIYQLFKAVICLGGIILTTSRGGYLFGALTFGASLIALIWVSENKKAYRRIFFITLGAVVGICLVCIVPLYKAVSKVIEGVFYDGLSLNGRGEIWTTGLTCWTKDPLSVIFGPGWCCDISAHDYTTNGIDRPEVMCPTIYHSWLLHTLCMGGIIALGFLCYHFYLKYKAFTKFDKSFMVIMMIGFISLDLYGLIDNTYHMYYFMMPLYMFIAVMDNIFYERKTVVAEETPAMPEE